MKRINDNRGLFVLSDSKKYDQIFLASNEARHTFRGLHYQNNPQQIKHVSIIQGKVIDFLYHLRTGEVKTYILTPSSEILTISKEYAHGYLTLEPDTIVYYEVEGQYNPETYKSIVWDTIPSIKGKIIEVIGINNSDRITISDKDKLGL